MKQADTKAADKAITAAHGKTSNQLKNETPPPAQLPGTPPDNKPISLPAERPTEHGGQKGPEPTRYGDWEKNGRCTDF